MSLSKRVEDEYGIEIVKWNQVKDVIKLQTREHGILCLKSYEVPEEEVAFIGSAVLLAKRNGFAYGPQTMATKTRAISFPYRGKWWMVTDWVDGRRPILQRSSDMRRAIRALADFHRYAAGYPVSAAPAGRLRSAIMTGQIESYMETLCDSKSIADMRPFIELSRTAIRCLSHPFAAAAVENEKKAGAFVHGDYNYPNIVVDRNSDFHLIDFENTSILPRMTDLAHILHRNYAWNGEQMLRWISQYDRHRPLSRDDCRLLHALLHVPYPVIRSIRLFKSKRAIRKSVPSPSGLQAYTRRLAALNSD